MQLMVPPDLLYTFGCLSNCGCPSTRFFLCESGTAKVKDMKLIQFCDQHWPYRDTKPPVGVTELSIDEVDEMRKGCGLGGDLLAMAEYQGYLCIPRGYTVVSILKG